MRGAATTPSRGFPHADTIFDQRALQNRLEASIAKNKTSILREPRVYWEEPGIHGSGREVSLRPKRGYSAVDRGRLPRTAVRGLPKPPNKDHTVRNVAIGAAVVGAVALGWYLWRHK